ncbi:MAG: HD domain-containing protein [Thermoplasmata archaeon]|nr:HD domain-containing protein [Thermoplasmata archaeon]
MKRIRCPIHNYVTLTGPALGIVDLPEFQRLRGIKQLGMAYMVYPGARHTRFEHSLGVCHLGGVVSDTLSLPKEDREMIALSGLLHDIGHGPFSHIMESVSGKTHEERSARKIKEGRIVEELEKAGIDPHEIADTIAGRSRLSPFISSEIDIDRMDYLLRDAHYTGVATGVDAGRLTAVMELDGNKLVFREAGLGAVEALLMARFMMYPYVYYHHTARSAERMLSRAINILIESGQMDEGRLWEMDDIALVAALRGSSGLSNELMRMIDERRLYKRGWEISLSQLPKLLDSDLTPLQLLGLLRHDLTKEKIELLEREIARLMDIEPEQVIIDFPSPPGLDTREIGIRLRDKKVVSGRSVSNLISILDKAQLDHWKVRVFVPEENREKAVRILKGKMPAFLHL